MDELDTQLMTELAAKEAEENKGQEPVKTEQEEPVTEEKKPEPKMYSEEDVQKLRQENAKWRIRTREAESQRYARPQDYEQQGQPQEGYPQAGQPQEFYDPRVDDMLLANKLSEIKVDPDFAEIYNEVDDEGITFEERLLEKAQETQWPITELDALALKMSRTKLFGHVKQKGIDEAYKSMSSKAQAAPERNVSSGKSVEDSEVRTVDDAINKAMKELGVTDLSQLR